MKVVQSRLARRHARVAALAYADRAPETVEGFRTRVAAALEGLSDFPELGTRVGSTQYRRIALDPYPYSLVYQIQRQTIRVLAVPHNKQSAETWF